MIEELEEDKPEEELDLSLSQLKGLGAVTEKKLNGFGVTSLIDLCVRGSKEIAEITGVTKSTTDTWCMGSHKLLEEKGIIRDSSMSVLDLLEYQKNFDVLKTKCNALDDLFNGGLEPEATYEIYGEFGSGKTQFCNTLTVEAINDNDNVVWIDCEDTFKPRRIMEILQARGYADDEEEAKDMLGRITYFYCPNTEQMMGTVNALSDLLIEKKPRLVVLDGAIGQFREEYLGRGTLAERQMQIARLMTHVKNISYYFKCTVIFTNQVMSDPSVMFGDPIKPIGGNVVAHASGYRLYFKKPGKKHIARMVDSPEHAQADAEFILNDKGVADLEEE
jgi:DNA repair protein RadA